MMRVVLFWAGIAAISVFVVGIVIWINDPAACP